MSGTFQCNWRNMFFPINASWKRKSSQLQVHCPQWFKGLWWYGLIHLWLWSNRGTIDTIKCWIAWIVVPAHGSTRKVTPNNQVGPLARQCQFRTPKQAPQQVDCLAEKWWHKNARWTYLWVACSLHSKFLQRNGQIVPFLYLMMLLPTYTMKYAREEVFVTVLIKKVQSKVALAKTL